MHSSISSSENLFALSSDHRLNSSTNWTLFLDPHFALNTRQLQCLPVFYPSIFHSHIPLPSALLYANQQTCCPPFHCISPGIQFYSWVFTPFTFLVGSGQFSCFTRLNIRFIVFREPHFKLIGNALPHISFAVYRIYQAISIAFKHISLHILYHNFPLSNHLGWISTYGGCSIIFCS